MTGSSLVVLAAGRGTRFGGLKQLVAVRDDGATVTDLLVRRGADAGIEKAVIVVRPEIEAQVRAHVEAIGSTGIPVELVVQRRPRGTADAVLAARDAVGGPFVVVNAKIHAHFEGAFVRQNADRAAVAAGVGPYAECKCGIEDRTRAHLLATLAQLEPLYALEKDGGLNFRTGTAVDVLRGDEIVSMNMWGFRPSVFDALGAAVAELGVRALDVEVYLPDVVSMMIAGGTTVRVLLSDEACIGITYREDVAAVRAAQS